MARALHREMLVDLYRRMLLIRRFDERLTLVRSEFTPGRYHVYIGQEATAVGAMAALRPDDYVATTRPNHGHNRARDAEPRGHMAEIYGNRTR